MKIDQALAEELGFPKAHYRIVERERRWLCREFPRDLVKSAAYITDLYVTGSRLRLREARPVDGSPPMLRLTRKADADQTTRLISSVYLSEDEFALLDRSLDGASLKKTRYSLQAAPGISLCVDAFSEALSSLIILEAEFEDDISLVNFEAPEFTETEITSDSRYSGYNLANFGIPETDV